MATRAISALMTSDDRGNWADCWFHGTWVGTRVGHMGPGVPKYPGINIPSSNVILPLTENYSFNPRPHISLGPKGPWEK